MKNNFKNEFKKDLQELMERQSEENIEFCIEIFLKDNCKVVANTDVDEICAVYIFPNKDGSENRATRREHEIDFLFVLEEEVESYEIIETLPIDFNSLDEEHCKAYGMNIENGEEELIRKGNIEI